MMNYYCDECIRDNVLSGAISPLSIAFKNDGNVPFDKDVVCSLCKRKARDGEYFYGHWQIDTLLMSGSGRATLIIKSRVDKKSDENAKSENHENPTKEVIEFWKHALMEAVSALVTIESMEKRGLYPEFWTCDSSYVKLRIRIPIDERGGFMHYMKEMHKTQYAKYKYFLEKNGVKI